MVIDRQKVGAKLLYLLIILLSLATLSCQNPVQLSSRIDAHQQQDNHLIKNESDYLYVFNKMEAQVKSAPNHVDDEELTRYMRSILCRLSTDYCRQVRIYILDNPQVNAHMLPNGAFLILTGLLLRIEDESQLAYVLAHELGHYVQKHGIKKINYKKSANSESVGILPGWPSQISLNAYTRHLEHQADLYSIELLIDNEYDLNSVSRLFKFLQLENKLAGKENKGSFNSTHPGTRQRILLLQERHNQIDKISNSSYENNSWGQIKSSHLDKWMMSELRRREFESTLMLVKSLKSNSLNPQIFDYYLGEIYRKQIGTHSQEKALFYYLNHLQGDTHNPNVYKNLADVYVTLSKLESAKYYYTKYLETNPRPDDYRLILKRLVRLQ